MRVSAVTAAGLVICALVLTAVGCADGGLPEEEIPVSAEAAMNIEYASYREENGYLVPTGKSASWGGLLGSVEDALKSGGVLPTDAETEITVDEGHAKVKITCDGALDAAALKTATDGTAATLLQFEGIEDVSFTVNGEEIFSEPINRVYLNPAYPIGDYKPFTVWYKTDNSELVPVTKEAPEKDAVTVIRAMMNEPKDTEKLSVLFPEGTKLNSAVTDENGVLHLDFSDELYNVFTEPYGEKLLMQGINMACSEIDGVNDVKVSIDGVEFMSEFTFSKTAATVFANR